MISTPVKQPSPVVTRPMPAPTPAAPAVVVKRYGVGQARAQEIARYVQEHAVAPTKNRES